MRIDKVFILTLIVLFGLACGSCRRVDNVVWSRYVEIPTEGWDPVNVIPYFPWPEDSVVNAGDRYSLLLCVRFAPNRIPAPLHIVVRQEDDSEHECSDTVRIEMRLPEVTPSGRGAYGVYETVDTIFTGIELRPGYCVELQSISDKEGTKGVIDIGLVLQLDNQEDGPIKKLKNFHL